MCGFSEFDFIYQINLNDDWVKGRSSCHVRSCKFSAISNSLTTSNTANVFRDLSEARILNPMYSVYLYSAITFGKMTATNYPLWLSVNDTYITVCRLCEE